jgi:transcriptional regulator with XRE-family HTH domain
MNGKLSATALLRTGGLIPFMATMTPVDRQVTARVISERERTSFSKAEIAEKLGLSKQGYQAYERYELPYTVAQLERLAHLFGRSLAFMLGIQTRLTEDEDTLLAAYRQISTGRLRSLALRQVQAIAQTDSQPPQEDGLKA